MASAPPAAPRIDALTGLRFAAAMSVVLYHYGRQHLDEANPLQAVLASGSITVGLFFVLSGFILTHTYSALLGCGRGVREFYVARFARIYPLYALALVLALPLYLRHALAAGGTSGAAAWACVALPQSTLLLQAWNPALVFHINLPGWSLSAEAFFYALFPLLLPRVLALPRRRVYAGMAIVVAASAVLPILAMCAAAGDRLEDPVRILWSEPRRLDLLTTWVAYAPAARVGDFLLGMLLGRLHQDGTGSGSRWGASIVAIGIILGMWLFGRHPSWQILAISCCFAPAFCALVHALASDRRDPLTALLSLAPVRFLGEASYAIYILQEPLYGYAKYLAGARGEGAQLSGAGFLAYAAALIVVSALAHIAIERPARRWLRARLAPALPPRVAA